MNLRVVLPLSALVVLLGALSLLAGKVWLPPELLLQPGPDRWILLELRLPRMVLGIMVGATLGLTGAVLQGYFRNPLADPGVVGVSSGAALGAVGMIFFGLAISPAMVFVAAMAGAILVSAGLGLLAGRAASPVTLVLAGAVLTSVTSALTTLLISLAPSPFATSEIVSWLMGALTDRGMDELKLAVPPMLVGMALLATTGRALDALSLGEAAARSLGVSMRRLQFTVIAGMGLAIGASVAVSGVVGFVGLIVPHLLRPLVGARPSALLLPSALGGAALVLAADSLVRLSPGAGEVRLGVAMALIGGPFFIYVLLSRRGELAWR